MHDARLSHVFDVHIRLETTREITKQDTVFRATLCSVGVIREAPETVGLGRDNVATQLLADSPCWLGGAKPKQAFPQGTR